MKFRYFRNIIEATTLEEPNTICKILKIKGRGANIWNNLGRAIWKNFKFWKQGVNFTHASFQPPEQYYSIGLRFFQPRADKIPCSYAIKVKFNLLSLLHATRLPLSLPHHPLVTRNSHKSFINCQLFQFFYFQKIKIKHQEI